VAAWPVYGHSTYVLRQPARLVSQREVMWWVGIWVVGMLLKSLGLPCGRSGRVGSSTGVPLGRRENIPAAIRADRGIYGSVALD
jgi:hypothetical protein